jgi:hypothetical protein
LLIASGIGLTLGRRRIALRWRALGARTKGNK